VDHGDGGGGQQLGDRVAVGSGVHGVVEGGGEAEVGGGGGRVQRKRGAGQRPGAERARVSPAPGVLEAAEVADQREAVRGELEAPQHRLRRLQVGEAGQHRVGVGMGGPGQGVDQARHGLHRGRGRVLQPQVQVGGDLVVAAAAGVELAARGADQLGEAALHRGVDVLVSGREGEGAGVQLARDFGETVQQELALAVVEHAGGDQGAHVGAAAGDVLAPQPPVDRQRRGVGPHGRVGRPGEPPRPQRPAVVGPRVTHPDWPGG
jgi:hypothetical protein